MLHLARPLLWSNPLFYTHVLQERTDRKDRQRAEMLLLKLETQLGVKMVPQWSSDARESGRVQGEGRKPWLGIMQIAPCNETLHCPTCDVE